MPPRLPPPILAQNQIIPPRGPGESAYQYRVRRTTALYGETPYQRRQRLGRERGLGSRAAAGHAREQQERQTRRQRYEQQYGVSPGVLAWAYAHNWLIEHGFTPETTGATWTYLHQMEPSLRGIWDRTNRNMPARVYPEMVQRAVELEIQYELDRSWALQRMRDKLYATIQFQDYHDNGPGNADWTMDYLVTKDFYDEMEVAISWWFYH